jgi:ketosteroid isomerase-like protein
MQPKFWVLLAAVTGLSAVVVTAHAQTANDPAAEVLKLLKSLDTAFEKGDVATVRGLMTDDKVAITPYYDGPQTKEDQIKSLPDFKMPEYIVGQRKTTVLGKDVVLVTYPLTMKGTFKGKPLPAKSYVSSLWINRDGKWKEALYQATVQSDR